MPDNATLVALVVSAVALVVAASQLTQQLLATAYVIKKCDRIVTGGVTKGGTRQWHWRQFRFTVKYQGICFALPAPLYSALGVQSTVQVDSPSRELWTRAMITRPKRTITQACWISFIQDLVKSDCIKSDGICLKEESGDRIPEDLTVAPTRVDAITVMLVCLAMGMQVSKYVPTTGEISMAGGLGGISSAIHPVLGRLLHYNVFASDPIIGFETARRHGHALVQEKGVWANAVFGRFKDRSYRPEFIAFEALQARKFDVLLAKGWPQENYADTVGGAAGFLAFTHVDVYEAVPPSSVRRWCAHFAEIIVKSHLVQLAKELKEHSGVQVDLTPSPLDETREVFIDRYGCSSPYLPWEDLYSGAVGSAKIIELDLQLDNHPSLSPESASVLACPGLITCASGTNSQEFDERDPSSYVPMVVAWEAIILADQRLRHIYKSHGGWPDQNFGGCSEQIIANAIRSLATVGPPSWGRASNAVDGWPRTFSAACKEALKNESQPLDRRRVSIYAHLSVLRAAYYTIMMRSASSIGPGITDEMVPDTALAYMA
ncbi:hypothetical protein MMC29_000781 [Sticta canariensis]|nr:hypothetical protein [Sticta canariensis]